MNTIDKYQVWVQVPSSGWISINPPQSHKHAHEDMRYLRDRKFLFKVEVRKYAP